jgi:hypothetical protein
MQEINKNLIVIGIEDKWDDSMNDYLKIYLSGSIDLGETFNWHDKFISGLGKLVDPKNGDLRFKDKKFLIMNPRVDIKDSTVSLDNPEFVTKTEWELTMMKLSDGIFCNFLKKSKSPFGMHGFLLSATSGKTVVRCPLEYVNFPYVKLVTSNLGIPLLGDTGTTIDVLLEFFNSIPRFSEVANFGL